MVNVWNIQKMRRLTEGSLNDTDLGGSGVDTSEGTPIVDNETRTNDIRTSVDGTGLGGNRRGQECMARDDEGMR